MAWSLKEKVSWSSSQIANISLVLPLSWYVRYECSLCGNVKYSIFFAYYTFCCCYGCAVVFIFQAKNSAIFYFFLLTCDLANHSWVDFFSQLKEWWKWYCATSIRLFNENMNVFFAVFFLCICLRGLKIVLCLPQKLSHFVDAAFLKYSQKTVSSFRIRGYPSITFMDFLDYIPKYFKVSQRSEYIRQH